MTACPPAECPLCPALSSLDPPAGALPGGALPGAETVPAATAVAPGAGAALALEAGARAHPGAFGAELEAAVGVWTRLRDSQQQEQAMNRWVRRRRNGKEHS